MPVQSDAVAVFVESLIGARSPDVFNPWGEICESEVFPETGMQDRRQRLDSHLRCPQPSIILLGEAPGYQGCRYSGMAFTSERLLMETGLPRVPKLSRRITTRPRPWSEPSATIVWGILQDLGVAEHAVLFNAFPWHPMKPGIIHSNRTPIRAEKEAGLRYLKEFLALYEDHVPVAALGNTAADSLNVLGKPHTKIRHPAYGGATKFREGVCALLQKRP
ncbi:MAG: uracil-DNA glycosylase [Rhodospirillales bacterium]|nr:uracil-DNA glycosylase [Rhodospirillales bacterium]MCB9964534.1 uracil-DNA glycosylase [Rhodospirillales bacterium]MCB9973807.1 uracil-DNA glycosylase [Rhodospirillales bacterium]MCB9980309.1 uracil-DNA glycosylase [Rhodospirillales bacterium]